MVGLYDRIGLFQPRLFYEVCSVAQNNEEESPREGFLKYVQGEKTWL